MIYDHIRNISLYKGLSDALDTALDFIASAELPMDNGTTLLPHGVKAIVSEYETKPTNSKGYEAHIKYADVQFLLAGSEVIRCCPIELLEPATDYDEASDCRFYNSVISSASPCDIPSAASSVILREPQVENPLESDPIVVLVIDPPPSFNSSKKQKQAEVTKNHSSLLSI